MDGCLLGEDTEERKDSGKKGWDGSGRGTGKDGVDRKRSSGRSGNGKDEEKKSGKSRKRHMRWKNGIIHHGDHQRSFFRKQPLRVALVGNANVGKSVIFNQMTGLDQSTGNWAGKTVELARGKAVFRGRLFELVDLPGTYSLSCYTEEEEVTRDYITSGDVDVVVNIVDATALERNLYLTTQVLELGVPMVVALNQSDLARKKGIRIDVRGLSRKLGVPVVETVAITGQGLKKLMSRAEILGVMGKKHHEKGHLFGGKGKSGSHSKGLFAYREHKKGPDKQHWMHYAHHLEDRFVPFGPEVEERVSGLKKAIGKQISGYPARFLAAKILEGDELAARLVASRDPAILEAANEYRDELSGIHGEEAATVMTSERYSISHRTAESVTRLISGEQLTWQDRLDRLTTHPLFGYIILIGVVLVTFFTIFTVGDQVSELFMSIYERSGGYVENALGDGWAYLILWDGVAQGFVAAIAFVLPYILPFYLILALLEDSGYLARVAVLMDALMHRFGLHGKAFIPMILGYGCTVPAVLGTRILETRRERFISAFLAGFIPCAARTTVIMALVGAFLGWYWALITYIFNILIIAFLGLVATKVLPGKAYGLIMEVPRYHLPSAKVVVKQSWMRLKDFVVVAIPVIIVGSVGLVLLEGFGATDGINWFLSPLTVWVLGLPAAVGIILLLGVLRKELTIVMLVTLWGTGALDQQLTAAQMIVFTMFVIFYIPCVSTMAALLKEFGWRATSIISVSQFVVALVIAGLFNMLFVIT